MTRWGCPYLERGCLLRARYTPMLRVADADDRSRPYRAVRGHHRSRPCDTRPSGPAPAVRAGWDLRWWPDVFPALVVALLQVGGTAAASHRQPERWSLNALGVALLLAGPVALLVRRRWPEVSLAVAFSAALAYWLTDYPRGPAGFPALIVALVSAVLAGRRAFAWGTLAVGYLGFTVLPPLLSQESWDLGRTLGLAAWLLVLGTGRRDHPQPSRAAG